MYVSLLHSEISTHALQFGKLIIKGLVSSPLLATALGIPQGAFQVFFILSGTYLSSRFKNIRTIIMIIYLFPTLIGVCLLWQLPRTNRYGVLFGYYIVSQQPFFWVHTNQADRIIRHIPRPLSPNAVEQHRRLHQASHRNGSRVHRILRGEHRRPSCLLG